MKSFFVCTLLFFATSTFSQLSEFDSVDFTNADNLAKLYEGENLQNLSLLSYNLTHTLKTDLEKFRAIYTWVCQNIRADKNQYRKVIKKRRKFKNDSIALLLWNNSYQKVAFKKLLKNQKTMCTGYAYLIKELSYLADIECKIIDGYGRSVETNIDTLDIANHSWNAVKLNNKWYLCDATWSSGYLSDKGGFVRKYNDGYFLTKPEYFALNHFPKDQNWLLGCNMTAENFVASPLLYGEAFLHRSIPKLPTTLNIMTEKNTEISFEIDLLSKHKDLKAALVMYTDQEEELKMNNFKVTDKTLSFSTSFKRRGYYDVHLKVNEDIIASYTIKVVAPAKNI
ncbi:hypothetical protein KH5_01390 [Urechidicola sp. KH5]